MAKSPIPQADPRQQNMLARQLVLQNGIDMWQPIYTAAVANPVGAVVNIPLRNVGLVKKLLVEVSGTVVQGAAETQNRTTFGPANFFSNVTLTDLANQTRINTAGWHLAFLATARRGAAFGAAFTNDSPISYGSNVGVTTFPAAVTTVTAFRAFFEIPLAYSDVDLRGAIFANVVNATFNLQLTINPNFFVASTATGVGAVYKSTTAQLGTLVVSNLTVHQNYIDQIPRGENGAPILPLQDLATAYLLNNTVVAGLAASQDNPIPYANFRDFMSTLLVYDNQALNAGTDINYFTLQSANYTNIFKYDPFVAALFARNKIMDDYPAGVYYFDYRSKPLKTVQYGNLQLIVNPSTVAGVASQFLVGHEALAIINQVTQAGSLSPGA